MRTIQIGLTVHKLIEAERRALSESEDQILERLLTGSSLPPLDISRSGRAWEKEGVILPEGTQLRVHYSGQEVFGEVRDGSWHVNGRSFASPSMAMIRNVVTKAGRRTNINGWNHWEVKRPQDSDYIRLASLRG